MGWTLMCSSASTVADDFAFLPLCPSGEDTGLIACVGVDKCARGNGIGLALLVRAMEDLRRRGMKGVLIDVSYPLVLLLLKTQASVYLKIGMWSILYYQWLSDDTPSLVRCI